MPRRKAIKGSRAKCPARKAVHVELSPAPRETTFRPSGAENSPAGPALPLPPVIGATIDDAALSLLQLDPEANSGFQRHKAQAIHVGGTERRW
jgi:hypothetical protein